MSTLHAPDLSAEQLAEIEAALAAVTSDWRPSGAPTGITYTDIFCGYGGSSIGLENAGLQLQLAANHWPLALLTAPPRQVGGVVNGGASRDGSGA